MKAFVAVTFVLFAAAVAVPFVEKVDKGKEYAAKCMAEHKVTPEAVQKIKAGDYSEVDDNAECYFLCFQQAVGLVDAEGSPNKDVIFEKFSLTQGKKEIESIFEKCMDTQGSTPCKKAFNGFKCHRDLSVM